MKNNKYIQETLPSRKPSKKLHFRGPVPDLTEEGYWDNLPVSRNFVETKFIENADRSKTYLIWSKNLSPWERLHNHQTLASCRRHAKFHSFRNIQCNLDIPLRSMYNHADEVFPHKLDFYFSPETVGVLPFNSDNSFLKEFKTSPRRGHPLKIGGISQRIHPDSIKTGMPSKNNSKSAPGYSRKFDGSLYIC